MARARGAAAALALVAGALCGIALVWGTAARRAELLNGIDGSLVVGVQPRPARRSASPARDGHTLASPGMPAWPRLLAMRRRPRRRSTAGLEWHGATTQAAAWPAGADCGALAQGASQLAGGGYKSISTNSISLSGKVDQMLKKVKAIKSDFYNLEADFKTEAHRQISISLKPRGDKGPTGRLREAPCAAAALARDWGAPRGTVQTPLTLRGCVLSTCLSLTDSRAGRGGRVEQVRRG